MASVTEDEARERIRRDATKAVASWIAEAHGDRAAHDWCWSCTPLPFGLPSDAQLAQGLAVALGEMTIDRLMQDCEEDMRAACREAREGP